MAKDISIKDLRSKLAEVADLVESGEVFRVIRRSKPSFIIMKVDDQIEGTAEYDWETVVDFTEDGKEGGAPLADVLKTLKKINR